MKICSTDVLHCIQHKTQIVLLCSLLPPIYSSSSSSSIHCHTCIQMGLLGCFNSQKTVVIIGVLHCGWGSSFFCENTKDDYPNQIKTTDLLLFGWYTGKMKDSVWFPLKNYHWVHLGCAWDPWKREIFNKMNARQSRRLLQTTRVLLHSNNVLFIKESTTTSFFFVANTKVPYSLVHWKRTFVYTSHHPNLTPHNNTHTRLTTILFVESWCIDYHSST